MSDERWITPETQRESRTRWWVRGLQVLLVLALILPVVYMAGAALAPVPAATASVEEPTVAPGEEPTIAWPTTTAAAGYGIASIAGAHGEDGSTEPVPMASLAKLVTMLVVLDEHPIDEGSGATLTLDATDVGFMQAAYDDAAPYFPARAGQDVSQQDLVEWSIVYSAANASTSLARWAFGDLDAFFAAAETWLGEHGLDDTVLADAAGLDVASVSTAADLVVIGQLALDEPVLAAAMGLESVRVPGLGIVTNSNRVLGQAGIDAGKTGALFVWGRNLLVSAVRELEGVDRRVVVVVLGAASEDAVDAAAVALLESVWPNIAERELLAAGTVVGSYTTPWGATADAVTTDAITGTVWGGVELQVAVALAEVQPDTQPVGVGSVTIEVAGEILESSVDASRRIPPPDLGWRLGNPGTMLDWILGGFG